MGFERPEQFDGTIDFATATLEELKKYIRYQEKRLPNFRSDPETTRDIEAAIEEARLAQETLLRAER